MSDVKMLTVADYDELVESLRTANTALRSSMLIVRDDDTRKLGMDIVRDIAAVIAKHTPAKVAA